MLPAIYQTNSLTPSKTCATTHLHPPGHTHTHTWHHKSKTGIRIRISHDSYYRARTMLSRIPRNYRKSYTHCVLRMRIPTHPYTIPYRLVFPPKKEVMYLAEKTLTPDIQPNTSEPEKGQEKGWDICTLINPQILDSMTSKTKGHEKRTPSTR